MKQKILAVLMIIAVLLCFMPTMAFADQTPATDIEPGAKTLVQESANDLSITKKVVTNDDGSYDLVLEAFATGTSSPTTVSKPLDIVLVLDVSGSMDDDETTRTYTKVSKAYSYDSIGAIDWWTHQTSYYYKVNDEYYPVYAEHDRKWNAPDEFYLYYWNWTGNNGEYIGKIVNSSKDTIYEGDLYTVATTTAKKLESMKAAAKNFVDKVATEAVTNNVNHKIAVVKFAGTKSEKVGNDFYREGLFNNYNCSQKLIELTSVTGNGASSLNSKIDELSAAGATRADFGMELANDLLKKSSANRQKVVVLFTDGAPTSTNSFEKDVANKAISEAKTMKSANTLIYTVGMIANPSKNVKNFLDYTSSNYPDASSMTNAGTVKADNYSTIVTDGSKLNEVFQQIVNEVVSTTAKADATSLLKDTLSDYFKFEVDNNNALKTCKVQKAERISDNTWGEPKDITDANIEVTRDGKNIAVSGFNYISEENLVVKKDGKWQGNKLVLTFSIEPDPSAEWRTGTHYYPTNDTEESKAGIYASNSGMLTLSESPTLPLIAAKVTYQVTGDSPATSSAIPAEKVYLVGTSVSVADGLTTTETTKDGKTGTWTFNGWDRSSNFTMTAENVTITGTWTFTSTDTGTYTVTYKDGMNEEFFADKVYPDLEKGTTTPKYDENDNEPTHADYIFKGWKPAVADTVTEDATYIAQWESKSEHLIKENLRIKVECVKEGSNHETKEYDTSVGGYSAVTNQDEEGNYTSTITVAASQYIEQYNKDMQVNHRLAAGETETKTIVVKFNRAYENFEIANGEFPVVFKVNCGDSELDPTYYTVTYTDGVEGEQVFADQVYNNLKSGDLTPAFDGTPTRAGYTFTGWYPAVAKTVTGNATYTAQWEKVIIPPTPTPDVYPLTITKQVVGLDTVPADYAVNVTITNRYGTVVRTVTLKANETKTIYLSYGEYTLTETAPAVEGYTQSGQTFSENNFVLNSSVGKNVTVTNTYTKDAEKPPVDPKPTDPKPTDPATPVKPNKPDENPNDVPKTGDDLPISLAIYGIIAAGALLGIRKAVKRETK